MRFRRRRRQPDSCALHRRASEALSEALADVLKDLERSAAASSMLTIQMQALTDEIEANRRLTDRQAKIAWGTATRFMADVVSGQISGQTGICRIKPRRAFDNGF
jgi:hypothetical protein